MPTTGMIPRRRCTACSKNIQEFSCETPDGRVCIHCAEAVYRNFAENQEIAVWHYSRFIRSLSGDESLRWRLTTLSRYAEAVHLAEKQKSSDVTAMHRLLVLNLGCLIEHPLNLLVRQLALNAAVQVGKSILPILLEHGESPASPGNFIIILSFVPASSGRTTKASKNYLKTPSSIRFPRCAKNHSYRFQPEIFMGTESSQTSGKGSRPDRNGKIQRNRQYPVYLRSSNVFSRQSKARQPPFPMNCLPWKPPSFDCYPIDGLKADL